MVLAAFLTRGSGQAGGGPGSGIRVELPPYDVPVHVCDWVLKGEVNSIILGSKMGDATSTKLAYVLE